MKRTTKSTTGTSFFGVTIKTTVNKLALAIGEPQYQSEDPGSDKVNYQWDCELDNGNVFTIYDWKEYRDFSGDEEIEFHIGAFGRESSERAKEELLLKLQ